MRRLELFLRLLLVLSCSGAAIASGWEQKSFATSGLRIVKDPTNESPQYRASIKPPNELVAEDEEIDQLMQQADRLSDTGKYEALIPIVKRILALEENKMGAGHPRTAFSLQYLASLYIRQGRSNMAKPLCARALEIREKALGPEDIDTAKSMICLAVANFYLGLNDEAEPLFLRALTIQEKLLRPDDSDIAYSLNGLASSYASRRLYRQAEPLFTRALAILERSLGSSHQELTLLILDNLGRLFGNLRDFDKASFYYRKSLDIKEKAFGSDSTRVADALFNPAITYSNVNLYDMAERLYLRYPAILKNHGGLNTTDTAEALLAQAVIYKNKGSYGKAESLYKEFIAIYERNFGPKRLEVAEGVRGLAALYADLGIYDKAEPLYKRALIILKENLREDDPDIASTLSGIGDFYARRDIYDKAESHYSQALTILEKALGRNHIDTVMVASSLAWVYGAQGSYNKAETLYLRALAALNVDHDTESLAIASILSGLGTIYTYKGSYEKASTLLLKDLAITQREFGEQSPATITSLMNLAWLYILSNSYEKASRAFHRALVAQIHLLQHDIQELPKGERQAFASSRDKDFEAIFSFLGLHNSVNSLALTLRLNLQGLIADLERRQASLVPLTSDSRQAANELAVVTQRLSSVFLGVEQREKLRARQEVLERQLYQLIPKLDSHIVEPKEIAAALPEQGVLVEFQRFQPYDVRKPRVDRWGEPQYIAMTLKSDGSIQAVQLGPAVHIDAVVHQALAATVQNQTDAKAMWDQVSNLVLRPLFPHLNGIRQWFISPDGELNRVPFASLPSPQNPEIPLAEAVKLRQLTTGRDLLRLQQPAPQGEKPLVLANPSYDRRGPSRLAVPRAGEERIAQQRSSTLSTVTWSPLPATAQEGQRVAQLLSGRLFSGAEATTVRLGHQQSPRILHIASHGFFIADAAAKPEDPLRLLQDQAPQLRGLQQEEPQLRSGLVLAGANQPDADPDDDGYLTAAEAVSLNLRGTELVVLSACNTAQGDVRTGEGVYGLQRSLAVAGARSTLLSLWKVNDAATAEFMTRFYKRLKAGEGRADALAATQREFREGLTGNNDWRAPAYWAAWQLVGDWRPIKGL
jgi:CHAT domain-containing protein/tetratricopeptide (TPR) repeat protein